MYITNVKLQLNIPEVRSSFMVAAENREMYDKLLRWAKWAVVIVTAFAFVLHLLISGNLFASFCIATCGLFMTLVFMGVIMAPYSVLEIECGDEGTLCSLSLKEFDSLSDSLKSDSLSDEEWARLFVQCGHWIYADNYSLIKCTLLSVPCAVELDSNSADEVILSCDEYCEKLMLDDSYIGFESYDGDGSDLVLYVGWDDLRLLRLSTEYKALNVIS